ncbi:ABC transporter substrate-binding protein [Streptomyces sp. NBC_01210]|uniref:ABC transporter substrate-binding protein n=1 Tax=Streptomyces sp. NBC_01210 TaxID=2903774 RepID=UPI002E122430|nr:ABC transporter substrate-binding protein [Streptomyces sp. NBC_01210]
MNPLRPLLACAVLLVSTACTGSSGPDQMTSSAAITIGYLAPLTGPDASAGLSARRGAEFAATVINTAMPRLALPLAKAAGLPHLNSARIKVVTEDTGGDAQRAAGAVDTLLKKNPAALSGGYESAVTLAASDRTEQLRVPFVNAESSATSLTPRGREWFFRTGPTGATFGRMFFSLLKQQRAKDQPIRRLAIVHTTDRFGSDGANTITDLLSQTDSED